MPGIDIILKYFPQLTELQKDRFAALYECYEEWNGKINVVSRKDFGNLYIKHVLHSLGIAKVCTFGPGARVLDVGTGGGFPGIPLAIMFPETRFTLADSIAKKITVVKGVTEHLGLENVTALNGRAEAIAEKTDYVVSRAVTEMKPFIGWVWNMITAGKAGSLPNGILYLKGGDLNAELGSTGKKSVVFDLKDYFEEDFFETKKVVYIKR